MSAPNDHDGPGGHSYASTPSGPLALKGSAPPAITEPMTPSTPSSSSSAEEEIEPPPHWHKSLPESVQNAFLAVSVTMDGPVVLLIIVIVTLLTIFLDDIKISGFGQSTDITFATLCT
jgi:hypothetical protein